jgi:hypothetical protein
VWGEEDLGTEDLLDLGRVAVVKEPSSSTVPKCKDSFGPRPAPETPEVASTTMPLGSIMPARTNGASASPAAVG